MSGREPVPAALPPEVVSKIWEGILPEVLSPEAIKAVQNGDLLPSMKHIYRFAEVAMGSPHFSTATDIKRAIGLNSYQASEVAASVRIENRKKRNV